jgi:hypothetical protein
MRLIHDSFTLIFLFPFPTVSFMRARLKATVGRKGKRKKGDGFLLASCLLFKGPIWKRRERIDGPLEQEDASKSIHSVSWVDRVHCWNWVGARPFSPTNQFQLHVNPDYDSKTLITKCKKMSNPWGWNLWKTAHFLSWSRRGFIWLDIAFGYRMESTLRARTFRDSISYFPCGPVGRFPS